MKPAVFTPDEIDYVRRLREYDSLLDDTTCTAEGLAAMWEDLEKLRKKIELERENG